MFEAFPELAQIKAIGFYALTSLMRPLGLLTTFGLINFALKRASMIRVGIAIALGVPVAAGNQVALFEIYAQNQFADRLFLPAKELLIGLAMGLLATMPFYGFKFAGALIDNYRGEGSNGLVADGSETTTTIGLLFYIAAATTFVLSDGLWYLMRSFYATYALWPLDTYLPAINPKSYTIAFEQIERIFHTMLFVGFPLLFLLFLAEFLLMIGSRVARRFGLNTSAFIVKNLVLLLVLPSYITIVVIFAETRIDDFFVVERTLEAAFQ